MLLSCCCRSYSHSQMFNMNWLAFGLYLNKHSESEKICITIKTRSKERFWNSEQQLEEHCFVKAQDSTFYRWGNLLLTWNGRLRSHFLTNSPYRVQKWGSILCLTKQVISWPHQNHYCNQVGPSKLIHYFKKAVHRNYLQ